MLLLTLCNILLTVRLIHSECPRPVIHPSQLQEVLKKNGIGEQNGEEKEIDQQELINNMKLGLDKKLFLKSCQQQLPIKTTITNNLCNKTYEYNFFNIDPRLGRWDNKRLYKIFDAVSIGDNYGDVSQKYSVCLATQSSIEKLYSLVEVSYHWTGPISVALFAAGDMEYKLVKGKLIIILNLVLNKESILCT